MDVDPTGEYIVGNGKLSADLTVHSFTKMMDAINNQKFDGEVDGIPILNFESVVSGVVQSAGLGPLHTEFDSEGYQDFSLSRCKGTDTFVVTPPTPGKCWTVLHATIL